MLPLVGHHKVSAVVWPQVTRFRTDPLMDQGPMRVRTGCAFGRAFADISKGCTQLTLPICLIASQTDKVGVCPIQLTSY